jgi:hypothetical protein
MGRAPFAYPSGENMQNLRRESLKPQSLLELMDRTFRIYRENFMVFAGLVAAVMVPVTIITLLNSAWLNSSLTRAGFTPGSASSLSSNPGALSGILGQMFGSIGISLLVSLIAVFVRGVLIYGPLTYIASEANLGRRVSVGEAFNRIRNRLMPLAGGLVVFYLVFGVATVALAFTAFLCGLGLGILIYVGVAMYVFLTPVLVLEQVGITDGMSRGWSLAKARFWQIFGLTALVQVISFVISFALSFIAGLITGGTLAQSSFGIAQIVSVILTALISIVLEPILPIGYTLMYYDARIRLEGLDMALTSSPSPEPRPSDVASPPPMNTGLNRDDVINMAILIVGGLILFMLYFAASFALVNALTPR